MAKQKMSKAEREECERNLALCQNAVSSFQQMLKEDDEAAKSASKAVGDAMIRGIAERDGSSAAILAIREQGRRPGQTDPE